MEDKLVSMVILVQNMLVLSYIYNIKIHACIVLDIQYHDTRLYCLTHTISRYMIQYIISAEKIRTFDGHLRLFPACYKIWT